MDEMDEETTFYQPNETNPNQVSNATTELNKGTVASQTTTSVQTTGRPSAFESHIFSLSVRSLLALIVMLTICYMSVFKIKIEEPLYTLSVVVVGFFFGQQKPKTPGT